MKSMSQILNRLYASLNEIDCDVYHYEAADDYSLPYIIWAEQGQGEVFHSNNEQAEQTIQGVVDFYTQTEFDDIVDEIQEILNEVGSFYLESVLYEDETKLIHYHWTWELS